MARKSLDWSATGWPRVVLVTIFGSLGCSAIALYVDSFNFATKTPDELLNAYLVNILLPLFLAGPLLFFFTRKLRELAIANAKMSILASTDSLTAVLNRGAFTMLVEAYLNDARTQAREMQRRAAHRRCRPFQGDQRHLWPRPRRRGAEDHRRRDPGRAARAPTSSAASAARSSASSCPAQRRGLAETVAERIRASVNVAEFMPGGSRPRRALGERRRRNLCAAASASPICSGSPTSGSTTPRGSAGTASRSRPSDRCAVAA